MISSQRNYQPAQPSDNSFKTEVLKGLSASPKQLSSKYFYDATGDAIFQQIMELPEYYPTRSEEEIISTYKDQFLKQFGDDAGPFNLVELGSGDGKKTKILLDHFLTSGIEFRYMPIDISGHVLEELKNNLRKEFPTLEVKPIAKEYVSGLRELRNNDGWRNFVLFMGANIGNFTRTQAAEFLSLLSENLGDNDLLLVGFDLRKDPKIIHAAYDDKEGVTRAFNLNLLKRINTELEADFNLENFIHFPIYDPVSGEMKSFLMSTKEQEVYIKSLNRKFFFKAWEAIFTEVSVKYDLWEINELAARSGFRIKNCYYDSAGYFVNVLFEKQ